MNRTSTSALEEVLGASFSAQPFPHLEFHNFHDLQVADSLLSWLESEAAWQPRKLDGFGGYADIALSVGDLPPAQSFLLLPEYLSSLRSQMARHFEIERDGYVRVTAHRILPGGSLQPHCDSSHIRFTHRLLVQLNRGWTLDAGGLLCLHDGAPSTRPDGKVKSILPTHNSAFAFEISDRSFHSVSRVLSGERYTLSYTFYPPVAA